ncbi:MAG: prepilin-type cleavage/methylation domain-containing protein, partial [Rubripirellula sp.]
GISPQSVTNAEFETLFDSQPNAEFQYSVEVMPAPMDGMLSINVSVQSIDQDLGEARTSYSLMRWVIDPMLGLEEAEAAEDAYLEEKAAMASGGET